MRRESRIAEGSSSNTPEAPPRQELSRSLVQSIHLIGRSDVWHEKWAGPLPPFFCKSVIRRSLKFANCKSVIPGELFLRQCKSIKTGDLACDWTGIRSRKDTRGACRHHARHNIARSGTETAGRQEGESVRAKLSCASSYAMLWKGKTRVNGPARAEQEPLWKRAPRLWHKPAEGAARRCGVTVVTDPKRRLRYAKN